MISKKENQILKKVKYKHAYYYGNNNPKEQQYHTIIIYNNATLRYNNITLLYPIYFYSSIL